MLLSVPGRLPVEPLRVSWKRAADRARWRGYGRSKREQEGMSEALDARCRCLRKENAGPMKSVSRDDYAAGAPRFDAVRAPAFFAPSAGGSFGTAAFDACLK